MRSTRTSAPDRPAPGLLDRPIADLALIDDPASPAGPPFLLTLDTVDVTAGNVRVALLRRSTVWQSVDVDTIVLLPSASLPNT